MKKKWNEQNDITGEHITFKWLRNALQINECKQKCFKLIISRIENLKL